MQRIGYLIFAGVLLVSYQNCSMQSSHKGAQDLSSLSKTCENALAVTYKETYYASFRTNCTACHDAGGESGRPFASANFNESWNSFKSLGRQKIEANAVSAAHKAPRTGPQHQALIDGAQAKWKAAEDLVSSCQQGMEVQTVKKALPATVYTAATPPGNAAAWPQLSFNLMTEVANGGLAGKIQMTVTVEVRRYNPPGQTVAVAYEFKNPRVTVTGTAPLPSYRIQGIKIVKNDMTVNDFTFFQNIDAVVNAGTPTLIQSGGNWAALWGPVVNTDQFALKFLSILDGSGLPITGTPLPPTDPGTLPTRVSYNELAGGQQALNVFAARCFSCHGANGAGGLTMTNYASAQASALLIQSRMNNFANPMPPSGALSANERALVDIWISSGTPQQ